MSGYTLTYQRLVERDTSNATEVRALLAVRRGDDDLGVLEAGKNAYSVEQQVSNEVGIRTDYLRAEDLFVIAEQVNDDGSVYFRVFVKPLVNLIWLAGIVFVGGSLIALWPDAREERRLAAQVRGRGSAGRGVTRPVTLALVLAAHRRRGGRARGCAPVPARAVAGHRRRRRAWCRRATAGSSSRRRVTVRWRRCRSWRPTTGRAGSTDEDYRALVGPLRREAAQALRALDDEQEQPTPS